MANGAKYKTTQVKTAVLMVPPVSISDWAISSFEGGTSRLGPPNIVVEWDFLEGFFEKVKKLVYIITIFLLYFFWPSSLRG